MSEFRKYTPSTIFEAISQRNYGVTLEEVHAGYLAICVEKGLQAVTICNHGSGRSYNVAKALTEEGFPTVCLMGGLDRLQTEIDTFELGRVSYELNEVPNLAVILTHAEQRAYGSIISQMRVLRYVNSEGAIRSMRTMLRQ
ncbi:MAG: hypothetical protein Q8P72_01615 [Candidatus Roizmanbacteria bacterium]|nr:hypothetical protein [Candidatus Roizmanbacteria bacterium]